MSDEKNEEPSKRLGSLEQLGGGVDMGDGDASTLEEGDEEA